MIVNRDCLLVGSVLADVCMHVCMCVLACVHACVCMCVCVYMCVHVYMHVNVSAHGYMSVNVLCMFVNVCVQFFCVTYFIHYIGLK